MSHTHKSSNKLNKNFIIQMQIMRKKEIIRNLKNGKITKLFVKVENI